ncbi:MAG: ATP-dependent DNA helicase [Candidatus Nanohaloarchaea archaeon]
MDIFPFEDKRPKQDELIEEVEAAIDEEASLVAHAPTGLGKTAATVTPGLEQTLEEEGKVFFLTPRHSQHEIALETVKKINERHNENVVSVDLIGKSHLCEADSVTREGSRCPRHDETFNENGELSKKAWRKIKSLKNQNLRAEELKQRCSDVCAYTVSLYMCQEADIIIGDYFHIFHPGIRDVILEKSQASLNDSILIVDEAHNLPSRTRSLFSHTVSRSLVQNCITETEKFGFYREEEHLEQLQKEIERLARDRLSQKKHEAEVEKSDLVEPVDSFHSYEEMIIDLEAVADEVTKEEERSYCGKLAESLEGWKGEDRGFFRNIERNRQGSNRQIRLKYTCLDPSISTSTPLNNAKASVLMSGTLKPQEMYEDLLGLEKAVKAGFSSPFPEENKLELIVNTVTTRYNERDDSMLQKYAWYLQKSLEQLEGSAGVFFPSYQLLNQIGEPLNERTEREVFMERRTNSKDENQRLLEKFKDGEDSVLLGVASGSFGEGVDYPGEDMKAVFIVGLPLKRPDLKTEALIDYLDEKYGKGWQYGYTYPGVNTAVQAAGRCIRSDTDTGVICFMDKRYGWNKYSKLLDSRPEETRAPWQEIEEFQKVHDL